MRDADVSIKQKIQPGWNSVCLNDTEDIRIGGTIRVPPGLFFERNKNKTTAMRYGGERKAWQLHERIREKQPFRLNTDGKTLSGFSGAEMEGDVRTLSGPG